MPELETQERASVHALGVLLGFEPDTLAEELAAAASLPAVPTSLPVGLPSDLLRRRPDVRRADHRGFAVEHLGHLLAEMQSLHRAHPGAQW